MKGVVPAFAIIGILITLGVAGTGLTVAYDTMEEIGMVDIPEDQPWARGIERAGEAIKRAFALDKGEFDAKRFAEREEEYEKYKGECIAEQVTECLEVCEEFKEDPRAWEECIRGCYPVIPQIEICFPPKEKPVEVPEVPECICTQEYEPVCCDGKTFPNQCIAFCYDYTEEQCIKGPCRPLELPRGYRFIPRKLSPLGRMK